MNAWIALAAALLLASSHFGAYRFGKHVEAGEALARQDAAQLDQDVRAAAAGSADARQQARLDAIAGELDEEVTRYALSDAGRLDCLDAAGVELFNDIGGHAAGVRPAPPAARARPPPAARRPDPR